MDYTRIQIDSIGIGLSNIYNLDLIKDNFIKTYLAVGELYNENHNITLDNNNLNHIQRMYALKPKAYKITREVWL